MQIECDNRPPDRTLTSILNRICLPDLAASTNVCTFCRNMEPPI
jgi:hypothetical protein